MPVISVTVQMMECLRCGHKWTQRGNKLDLPRTCANKACRSPWWNVPRVRMKRTNEAPKAEVQKVESGPNRTEDMVPMSELNTQPSGEMD